MRVFNCPCLQFKAFFDATGGLWQSGALQNKFCGFITSTATQGGGQEATVMSSLSNIVHHGMIYVAPGALTAPQALHGHCPLSGVIPRRDFTHTALFCSIFRPTLQATSMARCSSTTPPPTAAAPGAPVPWPSECYCLIS